MATSNVTSCVHMLLHGQLLNKHIMSPVTEVNKDSPDMEKLVLDTIQHRLAQYPRAHLGALNRV